MSLIKLFLQDVEASLMRALNVDDMATAQILRERLQTIDAAVQEIQVQAQACFASHQISVKDGFCL